MAAGDAASAVRRLAAAAATAASEPAAERSGSDAPLGISIGVTVGVRRDEVTLIQHAAHNVGRRLRVAANHEERRLRKCVWGVRGVSGRE